MAAAITGEWFLAPDDERRPLAADRSTVLGRDLLCDDGDRRTGLRQGAAVEPATASRASMCEPIISCAAASLIVSTLRTDGAIQRRADRSVPADCRHRQR